MTINMNKPKVSVLLSSYNGDAFIKEQIDSINAQTMSNQIIVRDDGSSDNTRKILDSYQEKGVLDWYSGPNLRPAKSFWDLLCKAPVSDYYSFCDQDDVWLPDKLSAAIGRMSEYSNVPCLYFSAKRLVDKDLNLIADTKDHHRLGLGEAMIYNPVTGCTMVINKALRDILISATPNIPSLHDSWIYRTCLAVGGKVIYDPNPHILYRQHGNNVVGHVGIYRRFKSFLNVLLSAKQKSARSNSAKELLRCYADKMTLDSKTLLMQLSSYDQSLSSKIKLLANNEMQTSSYFGRFTFILYVLFNKY